MIPKNADFGKRLKERREVLRLTQGEVALKMGITSAAVSRWERGDGMPTEKSLDLITKTLNTTADYLLGDALQSDGSAESNVEVGLDDELELRVPEGEEMKAALEEARFMAAKLLKVPTDWIELLVQIRYPASPVGRDFPV